MIETPAMDSICKDMKEIQSIVNSKNYAVFLAEISTKNLNKTHYRKMRADALRIAKLSKNIRFVRAFHLDNENKKTNQPAKDDKQ